MLFSKSTIKTHSQKYIWLSFLSSPSIWTGPLGELDPWEVEVDDQKNPKEQFPIFNPFTTCDNPQMESTNSGLFSFPADMFSLKKAPK